MCIANCGIGRVTSGWLQDREAEPAALPTAAEVAHPCRALGKDLEDDSFLDFVKLPVLLDGFSNNVEPTVRIEVS